MQQGAIDLGGAQLQDGVQKLRMPENVGNVCAALLSILHSSVFFTTLTVTHFGCLMN
jgi:hypothetical protein